MHPLIRILTLLVFAALVPWLPRAVLFVSAAALLAWCLSRPVVGRAIARGLRRVRFLLLSIAVLYLWFTPGTPLFPALGFVSPSDLGLALALERATVLVLMLAAAMGVLAVTPPAELAAGLRALLCWPVATPAGVRFAARIEMLLEKFPRVEDQVRASAAISHRNVSARAAALIIAIESDANASDNAIAVKSLPPVPAWQWCLPLLMLIAGIATIIVAE